LRVQASSGTAVGESVLLYLVYIVLRRPQGCYPLG